MERGLAVDVIYLFFGLLVGFAYPCKIPGDEQKKPCFCCLFQVILDFMKCPRVGVRRVLNKNVSALHFLKIFVQERIY